jgi:oxaloacetate decarboxylase alpha subunit
MESQLKDQGAEDKFGEVLAEIPRVREDLGFIPLVTPTSQIVGTQAVLNVLTGERYKSISKETQGVLKGEYGAAPAPYNKELQARVLDGAEAITCRPADLIEPEMDKLVAEVQGLAKEKGIDLAKGEQEIDDVLTYALFPQIGLKFLENRGNPDAFEPAPTGKESAVVTNDAGEEVYTVEVEGASYTVTVSNGGDLTGIAPIGGGAAAAPAAGGAPVTGGEPLAAPLAGNIFKVYATPGQAVQEGDLIIVLEAMKMETEVRAPKAGTIGSVSVKEGDSVAVGDTLLTIA